MVPLYGTIRLYQTDLRGEKKKIGRKKGGGGGRGGFGHPLDPPLMTNSLLNIFQLIQTEKHLLEKKIRNIIYQIKYTLTVINFFHTTCFQ